MRGFLAEPSKRTLGVERALRPALLQDEPQPGLGEPHEALACLVRIGSGSLTLGGELQHNRMLVLDSLKGQFVHREVLEGCSVGYTRLRSAYHQACVLSRRDIVTY